MLSFSSIYLTPSHFHAAYLIRPTSHPLVDLFLSSLTPHLSVSLPYGNVFLSLLVSLPAVSSSFWLECKCSISFFLSFVQFHACSSFPTIVMYLFTRQHRLWSALRFIDIQLFSPCVHFYGIFFHLNWSKKMYTFSKWIQLNHTTYPANVRQCKVHLANFYSSYTWSAYNCLAFQHNCGTHSSAFVLLCKFTSTRRIIWNLLTFEGN